MIAGGRSVAVLAFADELAADPNLLSAWADVFDGRDDITLVIHGGGRSEDDLSALIGGAIAAAGIDDAAGSPDLMAVHGVLDHAGEGHLVDHCGAVFTRVPPPAPFDARRTVSEDALSDLRDLLPAHRLTCSNDALERVSPELRAFVNECPNERRTILEFILQISSELPPGTRLLDVGAGEQPYRELFEHLEYVTSDWANSVHPGARHVDVIGPADNLPIEDCSFDAILSTQVLEHVAEPSSVLREMHRLLTPGGRLFLTLPLAWELHEEPFDFYRYTRYGISHLLRAAGFNEIDAQPRNDCFTTVAQLMRNSCGAMGRASDGLDEQRLGAAAAMRQMADLVESFAHLDTRWSLPLGYAVRAKRGV